ncbi:uncharacterized protein G2W53_002607 [Senna tora]|uniref:Uncharacterized protein n=1 Tax=Senna tora TaxID=362788 RepID=A0A834X8R4_9FABA|nr:uncharacterized protein G2W53_002607 [Senna tora]
MIKIIVYVINNSRRSLDLASLLFILDSSLVLPVVVFETPVGDFDCWKVDLFVGQIIHDGTTKPIFFRRGLIDNDKDAIYVEAEDEKRPVGKEREFERAEERVCLVGIA